MKISVKTLVQLDANADDWGLYEMEGAEDVALDLNEEISNLVEAGFNKELVRELMLQHMERNAKFGAADTEPRAQLDLILDYIF